MAYQSQGEPCPLGVRAHSTQSVASSHALAHGASLADICRAAGWTTRTPSQDSTVSALSQFLPVCWVTGNGLEELASYQSLLLCHSPSPGDTSAFFLRQLSSPDGEPWWNPPSTLWQSDWVEQSDARPNTGVSSPGLRSAPVLG